MAKITYEQHKEFFRNYFTDEEFLTKTAWTLLKHAQKYDHGIRTAWFYQIYRELKAELTNKPDGEILIFDGEEHHFIPMKEVD